MHFGSKPRSTGGAFAVSPASISAEAEVRRKSGLLPSAPANVPDVLLLEGIGRVFPQQLQTQEEDGSCAVPMPMPTLLTMVIVVSAPSVK
jgi:hypothetical protein